MHAIRSILIALSLCSLGWVWAAPHTHGQGQASLVLSGQTLTLELSLPLDVVLGFERAPRSDKERQALQQAMTQLSQTDALWTPSPAAQCKAQAAQAQTPNWGGSGHADLDVTYTWVCQQPMALERIQTQLFEQFKRLRRLDFNHVLPKGQGASRLTPKQPVWQAGNKP